MLNLQSYALVSAALSHAGVDQQRLERLARLEDRRLTPETELPPMQFLFRLFGKPCFPRGELVALTGKPKAGKTFVSSVLMSLCFSSQLLSMKRDDLSPLSVLWYDTEQSDVSTLDILKNRIMHMVGEEFRAEHFHVFNVRREPWRERLPLLEVAIEEYHPDLVVVDGIRDLVNDINDGELSQEVLELLMRLASEQHCCIVSLLHQNKSPEDRNLRGWIGTELTNKAFEVFECRKDKDGVFSFSQQLTRKYDIMDTLHYVVDEHGIPQLATAEEILEAERRPYHDGEKSRPQLSQKYLLGWENNHPRLDIALLFADALPEENVKCPAKQLQESVMTLCCMTSVYLYNSLREKALKESIIVKSADEFGHVAYYRPSAAGQERQTPAVPDDAEPELNLWGTPPGEVPF